MNSLKSSIKKIQPLYNMYLYIFNKEAYNHIKKEIDFFKKLGLFNLIFDIGANIGNKTKLFSSLGANVIAVEPDSTNYKILSKRFKKNFNVTILSFAISDSIGTSEFFLDAPGSAFNTLSFKWKQTLENTSENRWHTSKKFTNKIEVKTVTLDCLIRKYGKPDYIKIDVEGHELACIEGLSERIQVISFEANLPEFRNETLKILLHLTKIDKNVKFNYVNNDETFGFANNLSADEFYDFIKFTDLRYMDIFSFMRN